MAKYQGVMAGIGDRLTGVNLITPQFDAGIRKFMINKNGIMGGFELSGSTLSAGYCVVEGVVGRYKKSINCGSTTPTIYAVFTVNHDDSKVDPFVIHVLDSETGAVSVAANSTVMVRPSSFSGGTLTVTGAVYSGGGDASAYITATEASVAPNWNITNASATAAYVYYKFTEDFTEQYDDILNEAGVYTLPLYKDGVLQCNNHTYPERAYRSDRAKVIYGSLENGVTATTQPDEDNSQKIATTEYVVTRVQNEIRSQIGAAQNTYSFTLSATQNNATGTGEITFDISKKANYALLKISYTRTTNAVPPHSEQELGYISSPYLPKENMTFRIPFCYTYNYTYSILTIRIYTDGKVTTELFASLSSTVTDNWDSEFYYGYTLAT